MILWLLSLFPFLFLATDDGGSDGDGDNGDADKTKNPEARIRSLLEANERLARKLKDKDKEIEQLKQGSSSSSSKEVDFWRHVATSGTKLVDPETAMLLASSNDWFGKEDMTEVITQLQERYPYLTDIEELPPEPKKQGGRPVSRPKDKDVIDRSALEQRFPILKRGPHGERQTIRKR